MRAAFDALSFAVRGEIRRVLRKAFSDQVVDFWGEYIFWDRNGGRLFVWHFVPKSQVREIYLPAR